MTNGGASTFEVRRLLAALVASKPGGRIAEVELLVSDAMAEIVATV